jgi:hypothetical protein
MHVEDHSSSHVGRSSRRRPVNRALLLLSAVAQSVLLCVAAGEDGGIDDAVKKVSAKQLSLGG